MSTCNCDANCATNCCPTAPTITVTENIITLDDAEVAFYEELFSTSSGITGGTAFTLAHAPVLAGGVQIFLNGILLRSTIDYTISGTAVTLLAAVASSDIITARYMGEV